MKDKYERGRKCCSWCRHYENCAAYKKGREVINLFHAQPLSSLVWYWPLAAADNVANKCMSYTQEYTGTPCGKAQALLLCIATHISCMSTDIAICGKQK